MEKENIISPFFIYVLFKICKPTKFAHLTTHN